MMGAGNCLGSCNIEGVRELGGFTDFMEEF